MNQDDLEYNIDINDNSEDGIKNTEFTFDKLPKTKENLDEIC